MVAPQDGRASLLLAWAKLRVPVLLIAKERSSTMPLTVDCSCGHQFRAEDWLGGQQVPCPFCGTTIEVPVLLEPVNAPPPEPRATEPPTTPLPSSPTQEPSFDPLPYYAPLPRRQRAPTTDEGLVLRVGILGGLATVVIVSALFAWSYWSSSSTLVHNEDGELDRSAPQSRDLRIVATQPGTAESRATAKAFVDAVQDGQAALATGMLDPELMLQSATRELDIAERDLQHVGLNAVKEILEREIRLRMISPALGGGGYELVRFEDAESGLTALARSVDGRLRLDYHRFEFSKRDGKVSIADMYFLSSGESLTRILRREQILRCAEPRDSLIRRLTGWDRCVVELEPEFKALVEEIDLKPEATLDALEGLAKSVANEKSLLLMRIKAAAQVGSTEFRRAVKDFEQHYPDDAALPIVMFNYRYGHGQYHLALQPIDRLETMIGRDPYLDTVRGFVCLGEGRHADAKKYAESTIDQSPGTQAAYRLMVQISLAEGDYETTLNWLMRMHDVFLIDWVDLRDMPGYRGFVASPQHADWQQFLAAGAAGTGNN